MFVWKMFLEGGYDYDKVLSFVVVESLMDSFLFSKLLCKFFIVGIN